MFKQTIFLLFSCSILASVLAFQPTLIQQFLYPPDDSSFRSPAWHIGDDIVGFYPSSNVTKKPHKYLKITLETSQAEKILVDTVASCYVKGAVLDASYYHTTATVFLYYCAANNSLLVFGQDYTVQDAIPISTSQTFEDVILGHNEQGYVYILGLPNLISVPPTKPTELILVDLKTKEVMNHVVFDKGDDSQVFVTGYASDSESSYILTRGYKGAQALIKISKIVLSGNDYELTPFANFSYKEDYGFFHNKLQIVDGYLFTNDWNNLLIFDKNGSLFQQKPKISFRYVYKGASKSDVLYFPEIYTQIGGSTLYAIIDGKGYAYSLQNGMMTSKKIAKEAQGIVLGGLDKGDLLFGDDTDDFYIKDIKTDTTIYTSVPFNYYNKVMVSASHYLIYTDFKLFVFDRKKAGQLLKIIPGFGIPYLDEATNLLVDFSGKYDCHITYTDLETLAVRDGPTLPSAACQTVLVHTNITDPARPFLVGRYVDRDYYFISPSNYGAVLWQSGDFHKAEGILVPGVTDEAFTYVWNPYGDPTVIHVDFYKYDKVAHSFTVRDSFTVTTTLAKMKESQYLKIGSNKAAFAQGNSLTIIDFTLRNYKTYEVPAYYDKQTGIGVVYDKNKTPYVMLSENYENFDIPSTTPQLFDYTNMTTVPGVIPDLTKVALVLNSCTYSLLDKFDTDFAVLRLYDVCQSSSQYEQISL